jgi:capsular exopolysaccharide synthesis family protein
MNSEAGASNSREIWAILFRRRWTIVLGAVLGVTLGAGLASTYKSAYEGSALLRIDEKRVGLPSLDPRAALVTGNQVGAEMAVLRSRTLAEAVVDSLQMQLRIAQPQGMRRSSIFARAEISPETPGGRYRFVREADGRFRVESVDLHTVEGVFAVGERIPIAGSTLVLDFGAGAMAEFEVALSSREAAVDALVRRVEVKQPSREAAVVRVQYRSSDPEMAREVPNILATRFVELQRENQQRDVQSTIGFLQEQLDTIGQQLVITEIELQAFRESEQMVDPEVERTTQVRHLAELQAERGTIEVERAALAELMGEVRMLATQRSPEAPSPYRRVTAFPALIRSQVITELVRSLTRLEDERATLIMRRRPTDPDVMALTARTRELEMELETTVTTYLQGLTGQVRALDRQLAQYQNRLDRIPAKEVRYARLARQATLLGEVHGQLQTRLKEAEIADAANDTGVRVIDTAVPVLRSAGSLRIATVGIFGMLGLFGALGLAFLREYRDQSVHTRGDVQLALGVPVLGLIPRQRSSLHVARSLGKPVHAGRSTAAHPKKLGASAAGAAVVVHSGAYKVSSHLPDAASDAYDQLRTNIRVCSWGTEAKTLLLTSALPGDGKTTTAVNLAATLARRGLKVILVDADLRRGCVHTSFGLSKTPGLADVLQGKIVLSEAIQHVQVRVGTLDCLTAGSILSSPVGYLEGPRFASTLRYLAEHYDSVIIDSAPVGVIPDTLAVAANVDAVVVVARAGATPFEAIRFAAEQLRTIQAPLIGAVLNDIDFERDVTYDPAYRSYGYYASYYTSQSAD